MPITLFTDWERKNQSRRYPLDERYGVEPIDLISDLSISVFAPDTAVDIYLSSLTAYRGRISVSFRRISDSKIVLYGGGTSDEVVTLESELPNYTGSISFGYVGPDVNIRKSFNSTEGRLTSGVVYSPVEPVLTGVSNGVVTANGDVAVNTLGGLEITVEEVKLMDAIYALSSSNTNSEDPTFTLFERLRSIKLSVTKALNREVLPDCAVPPEEYFARRNTQGIIAINNVEPDSNGDIVVTGINDAAVVGTKIYTSIPYDRAVMCAPRPLDGVVINDFLAECESLSSN